MHTSTHGLCKIQVSQTLPTYLSCEPKLVNPLFFLLLISYFVDTDIETERKTKLKEQGCYFSGLQITKNISEREQNIGDLTSWEF